MYTKTHRLYNTPPHWCVVVHRSASLHGIRGSGQSPSWSLHPSTASHLPFSATLLPQKLHREPITARPSHQPPRTSHYCMPCPAPCPSRALPPLPRQPPPLRQTPVGTTTLAAHPRSWSTLCHNLSKVARTCDLDN